jgi:hypothetical protein
MQRDTHSVTSSEPGAGQLHHSDLKEATMSNEGDFTDSDLTDDERALIASFSLECYATRRKLRALLAREIFSKTLSEMGIKELQQLEDDIDESIRLWEEDVEMAPEPVEPDTEHRRLLREMHDSNEMILDIRDMALDRKMGNDTE